MCTDEFEDEAEMALAVERLDHAQQVVLVVRIVLLVECAQNLNLHQGLIVIRGLVLDHLNNSEGGYERRQGQRSVERQREWR